MSTVVLSETWTGSNGSAWPAARWRSVSTDSGSNVTDIQSNKGRQASVSSNLRQAFADISAVANGRIECEMYPSWASGNTASFAYIYFRMQADDTQSGYRVLFQTNGNVQIYRRDAGASTSLSSVGSLMDTDTAYRVIVEFIGSTIRYKMWPTSGSEPGSWTASVTDSTYTTGAIGLMQLSSDATVRNTDWDDLTITDLDGPLSVAYGSYVGDGLDDKAVATPFALDVGDVLVLVKVDTSATSDDRIPVMRLSNMPAGESKRFTFQAFITTGIKAFSSSGFTVGTHGSVNRSGNTYHWVALKAVGDVMKLLSYVGDGVDNHAITGAGFAPVMALTTRSGSQWDPLYRHTNMAAGDSRRFGGTLLTDGIKSLDADGFTLGTNALGNGSGVTFYAAVFKASAGNAAFGTYTGNGTSPRDITGFGLQPDMVFAQALSGSATALITPSVSAGDSLLLNTSTKTTSYLAAILSDGMTVANSLNGGGIDHVWWAFATPAAAGGIIPLIMHHRRMLGVS